MASYRIPRLTDRTLLMGILKLRSLYGNVGSLRIVCNFPEPIAGEFSIPSGSEDLSEIEYILSEESQLLTIVNLVFEGNGSSVIRIVRNSGQSFDTLECFPNAQSSSFLPSDRRNELIVRTLSTARREFFVSQTEASLPDGVDSDWSRLRDNQVAILTRLNEISTSFVSDVARMTREADSAVQTRAAEVEERLRLEAKAREEEFEERRRDATRKLEERDNIVSEREKSFETKEARYVARQKMKEQAEEIQGWMSNLELTPGTRNKYLAVLVSSSSVGLIFLAVAVYFSRQFFFLLEDREKIHIDAAEMAILVIKSAVPFAISVSLMVFVIRWVSSWANTNAPRV